MKRLSRLSIFVLALNLSMSCFILPSAAQEFFEPVVEQDILQSESITNYKTSVKNPNEDHEAMMSEYVSSLVDLINNTVNFDELYQSIQTLSENITISDVQVSKPSLDFSENNRVADGDALLEGMVVKIFYDNGESWIEHTKTTPLKTTSICMRPLSVIR